MRFSIQKYTFAIVPLILCVVVFSFSSILAQAQDGCDPGEGDCGSSSPSPAPVVNTTPASSNAVNTGSASPNTTGGSGNNGTGVSSGAGGGVNGNNVASGGTGNGNVTSASGGAVNGNGTSGGGGSTGGTFFLQNPLSSQFTTVGGIVGGFTQIFAYLVVLLAVLMIIYVGLRLVLAQGNSEEISKRKEQLLWLVVGVALVIGARIIVQVVISTLQSTGVVNQTVITNASNALQGH